MHFCSGDYAMTADAFADRLARVRQRFVSTLKGKIDGANASIARLADLAPDAAVAVDETYRCMHGIVGVAPTDGLPAAGRAAQDVDGTLRAAQRDRRGLRPDEILLFAKRLQVLREASDRELQFFYSAAQ